jgi:hypothetical protein
MAIGPFLTRRQAWEHVSKVLGVPASWRYFDVLCTTGRGPVVARRYGKRCLYLLADIDAWVEAFLRPGDKAAAA